MQNIQKRNKSKLPISWLSNLILRTKTRNPKSPNPDRHRLLHNSSNPIKFNRISPKPTIYFTQKRNFCVFTEAEEERALQEMFAEIEREEHNEREAKRKAGIVVNDVEVAEEDYLGVGPMIDRLEAEISKPYSILDKLSDLDFLVEPTDSDSDSDSEDEEEQDPVLMEEERKVALMFDRIFKRHQELLHNFTTSTLADRNSILLRDTRFENSLICQPQQRNIHGRIFGGFLMHRAFELAFSTAYSFAGARPCFEEVDHVDFLKPVDVVDFLRIKSCVLYTELENPEHPLIHVKVVAHVTRPEITSSELPNTFYFTFTICPEASSGKHGVALRNVVPATEEEARLIIEGKDAKTMEGIKATKK